MWTTEKFIREFQAATAALNSTIECKNADYAGDAADPFANFSMIEEMTRMAGWPAPITAEQGIIVRITDKFSRILSLVHRPPAVAGESFADTCIDLAGYSIILGLLRRSRTEPDEAPVTVAPVDPVAQAPTPWDLLRAAIAQAAGRGPQGAPEA